ncbi:MAG: hypothetical protein ABWY27_20610 [Telluria sp.]
MKSSAWLFAAAISAAGAALAQTEPQSTVTETTDPAKIADIERRAQELASRAPSSSTTATTADESHRADKHNSRSQKHKSKNKRANKDKASSGQAASSDAR